MGNSLVQPIANTSIRFSIHSLTMTTMKSNKKLNTHKLDSFIFSLWFNNFSEREFTVLQEKDTISSSQQISQLVLSGFKYVVSVSAELNVHSNLPFFDMLVDHTNHLHQHQPTMLEFHKES